MTEKDVTTSATSANILAAALALATGQRGRRSLHYVRGVIDMAALLTGCTNDEVRRQLTPPIRETVNDRIVTALASATPGNPMTIAQVAESAAVKRTSATTCLAALYHQGLAHRDQSGRILRYWPARTA